MNIVKLIQSKTDLKIHSEINGESVSEFSDLTTILQAPFFNIAERIIAQLDAEICDEYQIVFSGYAFQYKVLLDYAEKSRYCNNVVFNEIDSIYSECKIKEIFSRACNAHNLEVKTNDNGISLYSEISFPNPGCDIKETSLSEAEICILKSVEQIPLSKANTVLLIGNTVEFLTVNSRRVIKIPLDLLPDFLNFYHSYNHQVKFVSDCKNALGFVKLSEKEEKEISSVLNNTATYYITDIPSVIDDSDCINFEFESYPRDKYYISCDNAQSLSVQNNKIKALSSGNATVIVKDEKGNIVYSKKIELISHRYATEIRIVPRFNELKINERNKIDVIVLPQTSEDAKEITYSSSDENILSIDNEGNVLALNTGTVTVTVSGKKVKTSLDVTVMPNLERIYFMENSISLKIGQTKFVECNTIPVNASTNGFIWQFDNNSIASINYSVDGKKCKITAATQKEGKGNLRCYDPKTGYSAVCPVDVYARIRLNLLQKFLYVLAVVGFFYPPILLIPIAIDVLMFLNTKEQQKKKVYIFNIVLGIISGLAGLVLLT